MFLSLGSLRHFSFEYHFTLELRFSMVFNRSSGYLSDVFSIFQWHDSRQIPQSLAQMIIFGRMKLRPRAGQVAAETSSFSWSFGLDAL